MSGLLRNAPVAKLAQSEASNLIPVVFVLPKGEEVIIAVSSSAIP